MVVWTVALVVGGRVLGGGGIVVVMEGERGMVVGLGIGMRGGWACEVRRRTRGCVCYRCWFFRSLDVIIII